MTTTRTRRWRLAAAGIAIAATSFTTTAACGSDVVDDGVEQEVEDTGDEVQEEGGEEDEDG